MGCFLWIDQSPSFFIINQKKKIVSNLIFHNYTSRSQRSNPLSNILENYNNEFSIYIYIYTCAYIQPYPSTSTLGRKRSLNIHNVCPSPRSDYKHILITVSSFFTAALSLKKLSRRGLGTKNGEGQSLERQEEQIAILSLSLLHGMFRPFNSFCVSLLGSRTNEPILPFFRRRWKTRPPSFRRGKNRKRWKKVPPADTFFVAATFRTNFRPPNFCHQFKISLLSTTDF